MKTVTLDALIPREDFEVLSTLGSSGNTRNKATLSIEDLRYDSFFFSALRKPIFQRETNEWEPTKVCSMIQSFVNGELVPAIILWRNQGGFIFVIDGAHRLSSLGAWINDDYGDGNISFPYYGNYISQEQRDNAERTRALVNQTIGSYSDIARISRNLSLTKDSKKQEVAKNLGALALQLQWVEGDAHKAEDSFLKINQSATKISDAELELITSRDKAYAIAARAVVRAGRGYQYWSSFEAETQTSILEKSKKIHDIMFGRGSNVEDINSYSIGGEQSSNLTLDVVTQTVKICNDIDDIDSAHDGTEMNVVKCLDNTLTILEYINSKKPFSLGLHPFVYFYSDVGRHKIGSYYGILLFVKELIKRNKINSFIKIRERFEQVIYHNNFVVQQIIRKNRQSKKAYVKIKDYYFEIMRIALTDVELNMEGIIAELKKVSQFTYLQTEIIDNELADVKGNFSRGSKLQIKLRTFIANIPKCPICGGYLDNFSNSVDHIVRKQDGGTNSLKNAQVTHLYCNTSYKN